MKKRLNGYLREDHYVGKSEVDLDQLCFDLCKAAQDNNIKEKYNVIDECHTKDGYDAYAVKIDNTVFVVNPGTNTPWVNDLRADYVISKNEKPSQFYSAEKFYNKVLSEKVGDCKVISTGYSLGGGTAQYMSTKYDFDRVVTIAPLGVSENLMKEGGTGTGTNPDNIVNYLSLNDKVIGGRRDLIIEKCYDLKTKTTNSYLNHDLKNYFQIQTRVPISSENLYKYGYVTQIPLMIEKTKDTMGKLYEIFKSLENGLSKGGFGIFSEILKYCQDDINSLLESSGRQSSKNNEDDFDKILDEVRNNNLLKNKQTNSLQSDSDCPGFHSVSCYTRSDGTVVNGYERTCWKHGSKEWKQEIFDKYKNKRAQDLDEEQIKEFLEAFFS